MALFLGFIYQAKKDSIIPEKQGHLLRIDF